MLILLVARDSSRPPARKRLAEASVHVRRSHTRGHRTGKSTRRHNNTHTIIIIILLPVHVAYDSRRVRFVFFLFVSIQPPHISSRWKNARIPLNDIINYYVSSLSVTSSLPRVTTASRLVYNICRQQTNGQLDHKSGIPHTIPRFS